MPADNAVAAHQAPLDVEEVHGATLALYQARLPAVELGHYLFGITAQEERVRMVAVGCNDPVAFFEGLQKTCGDGLLPDIHVEVAPDLTLPEALLARLLEGPDQGHPTVQIYEKLRAGRYGAPVFTGLYAPVFRVLVICRHQRPLPSQRYKPKDRIPKPQVSYVFSTCSYTLLCTPPNHSRTALSARALWESVFLPSPISA
jgi:hypothetical protein